MLDRKLRIAQYGCGKMSVYTMRYVFEKGAEIVAAFDVNPDVIGKDIGQVMGTENKGIIIQHANEVEQTFKTMPIDVCIVTTMSLMKDLADIFLFCAKHGVNAVSTCEEAFYPWNSSPELTGRIDALAKKAGCTICGTGYQDLSWSSLIDLIAGSTHKITKIIGRSSYNVEDYGIALAQVHGAGLSLDEFSKQIAAADDISDEERKALIERGEFLPSYMWNSNGVLCNLMGLTVTRQTQKCVPQTYDRELKSETLGMTIPAGYATGMAAVVTTQTKEGIVIESECIGKVYTPDEYDKNEWTILGEPNTTVVISRPATVELTCASIVNRIPDVINAPNGFTTVDQMPPLQYRTKPLNTYCK